MTLDELRKQATLEEGNFRAWDTMAVELEVAELLYALVRAMKPTWVVEAGSGKGYASRFIAEALAENRFGVLTTYEPDPVYAEQAEETLSFLPALVARSHSTKYSGQPPDLVFVDSLGDYRDADIDHWLGTGPLVVVHDANGYDRLTGGVRLTAGRGVWIGKGDPS